MSDLHPTASTDQFEQSPLSGRSEAVRGWEHVCHHARWGIAMSLGPTELFGAVNPAFAEMHGYTVEELAGKPIAQVFSSAARDRLSEYIRRAEVTGRCVFEADHLRKDGTTFPAQIDVSVAKDEAGRILYRAVYVQDCSERAQTAAALRESEARARERLAELEHIYATAPVGLALHDSDLRILRINELLAAMDGLPVADHIGRTVSELLPELGKVVDPIARSVVESGEPALGLELSAVTSARPSMIGLVSFYPLKSPDGKVKAVSVVVQDITERKRAEQALRESEERLSRVLESAMDAIVTMDERRVVQLFNSAAEEVFRCKASEAVGRPFDRFASAALRGVLDRCCEAFRRSSARRRYLWAPEGLTAIRQDGEKFPVEVTISHAEAGGQAIYTLILRDVNDRKLAEQELHRLRAQLVYLRDEAQPELEFGEIVGTSKLIRRVLQGIQQVAETDSTVLITGETGTGKELVARAIHARSRRRDQLLVTVNCAALPAGLIESELFGHEKGAFTGALSRKIGRFETASGGTIFLDEIGDLPLELQAKLLRVLQDGEIQRVGATETKKVDVRVIAATNRELSAEVGAQRFRADLFYRLNVFPIHLPPLRDRREDIPALVRHLVSLSREKMGKRIQTVPPEVLAALVAYDWPGNIRELQNVVERGVILSRGTELEIGQWPPAPVGRDSTTQTLKLDDLERGHILKILQATRWRISGREGAAAVLGLKPTTLHARMKKFGIHRPS